MPNPSKPTPINLNINKPTMIPNIIPNSVINTTNNLLNNNNNPNFNSAQVVNKMQIINEDWLTDDSIKDAAIDQSYKDI